MEELILSVDLVLKTLVGRTSTLIDALIAQAQRGEVQLTIPDLVLYCALYSVSEKDSVNLKRFVELLKYSYIRPDTPDYLGPQDRESWTPSREEIDNWRRVALREG